MNFNLKSVLNDFTHLFFPHICTGCGTDILGRHSILCIRCISQLPVTNFHLYADNPIEKIFHGRIPVCQASSFCYFTKDSLVQRLLHQFKYRGNQDIGYSLGKMIGAGLRKSERFNTIDALIPLPLFAARERKRGYNQSAVLCEGMSKAMGLPVLKKVIMRKSYTETQTVKNRMQRWQNMEGRFTLTDKDAIAHKHILLVDDVITTGATLEACGIALLEAENVQLSIVTMAITVK